MPSLYSVLSYLLTVTALTAKAHASPHHVSPAQVNINSPDAATYSSPLGLCYGRCYRIGTSQQPLGGDGSGYPYYKLGGSKKRTFQVWHDRSFAVPSGHGSQTVREGNQFYLWDVDGSTNNAITNGGSWAATNLAGNTYPGFYAYNYYIQFYGKKSGGDGDWATPVFDPCGFGRSNGDDDDNDYASDGLSNINNKVTVEVGVKEISHSGDLSAYRGLKINNGYLQNEKSTNTIPLVFKEVACPYHRDDGDW